ncbi:MAG: flagellar biosynthetic protein FliO [Nitrospinae bacterium]|nr:flagellar biosynthetic protein FliO [Nitrospinota bacterium]
MKKTFARTLFALLLMTCAAEAAPNSFKNLVSSNINGGFSAELAFEKTPEAFVNYFQNSIRIDVVDGVVSPPIRKYEVNRPDVKSINVYQYSPHLLRVSVTPGEAGMRALKDSFSYESNGSKLVLNVGKTGKYGPVGGAGILTEKPPEASKTTPKAEEPASDAEKAPDKPSVATAVTTAVAEPTVSPAEAVKEGGDYLANIRRDLSEIKNEGTRAEKPSVEDTKPQLASLQPQSAAKQAAPPQAPGLGEAFLKIGSALMVVLALIFLASFAARKYLGKMGSALGSKKRLKVLGNHFIGVKKEVTVVEMADEILVLGVTNASVNLLARYDDPEKCEAIRLAHGLSDKPTGIFKKFPMFGLLDRKAPERPADSRYARTASRYAENAGRDGAENDLVSDPHDVQANLNAVRALKARLRALSGSE